MKKETKFIRNKLKCDCQHKVGHICNARFCWCEKHWEESVEAGFIKPNYDGV